jgi:DNA-binding HxlR family transcriptional regulator
MLGNTYNGQVCSAARALEVIGERWTLLIVRDAFLGIRRFDDFQRSLGVARNVLQGRLERLVENGILDRVRYQERPERFEYRLTEKGLDLWPIIVSLLAWGDRHMSPDGEPVVLEHRDCGGRVNDRRICESCGALLGPRDVRARRGPALADAPADRVVQPALAARD